MAKHTFFFLFTSIFNVDDMFESACSLHDCHPIINDISNFHYQIRCVVRAKEKLLEKLPKICQERAMRE